MHIIELPLSLYSFKLRLAIALMGVSVERRLPPEGSYRSPAFLAISPAGTVPTLVDGDFVLSETDTIIEFLDETRPGPRWIPVAPEPRARNRMLSRWVDLRLEAAVRQLFPHVVPAVRDAGAVEAADVRIANALALLAHAADPDGPYLLGVAPGMADCGLLAVLVWHEALRGPLGLRSKPSDSARRTVAALSGHEKVRHECADYAASVREWVHSRLK